MAKIITFFLTFVFAALLGGALAEAHGYRHHHARYADHDRYWHHRRDAALVEGIAPTPEAEALPSAGSEESSGLASWYRGRGGGLTAAHRSFPFGTRVLVTNRANGRSVVVRINDRGPFIRGRVIDLNHASASAIGVTGVSPVVLRRL